MSKYSVYILLKGVFNIDTLLHEQIYSIYTAKRCIVMMLGFLLIFYDQRFKGS